MRRMTFGFGADPAQSANHFFVLFPLKGPTDKTLPPIQIYERFAWTEGDEQSITPDDVLRLEVSRRKWGEVKSALTTEFNARLKKDGLKIGKFPQYGGIPLERLFGKEMMVLLWGIEDSAPSMISTAIRNWRGLLPEERWWLYTMTNASTGGINDRKGWRRALRFALCENPVVERSLLNVEDCFDD